jgi:hypothetical protein
VAALLLLTALGAHGGPWDDLHQRSVSRSRQFIIYSPDPNARSAVAMAAEDAKDKFLQLLDTNDDWKHPIVIDLSQQQTGDPSAPPSLVRLVSTEDGFKVEFNIVLGDDPRAAHFPQQLIRALLLEYAYRNQTRFIQAGGAYFEPPAWLMDGIASLTADPDPDTGSSLFQSLIDSGKTPTLADFLEENPAEIDDTPSRRLYSACSMSLVRLLTEMPGGRAQMRDYIRHWPGPNADAEAELRKAFPSVDTGGQSLEKWWTLGLASLSAEDRYMGLSLAETGQKLDAALTFDVVMTKAGRKERFTLDQYPQFAKAIGGKAALAALSGRLVSLETQCNPLLREVVLGYEELAVQLSHHQSRHFQARLTALAEYRKKLTEHMDQIADYLNWFEATQRTQDSGSFDEYVRTADAMDKVQDPQRNDAITKYMDGVEQALAQ